MHAELTPGGVIHNITCKTQPLSSTIRGSGMLFLSDRGGLDGTTPQTVKLNGTALNVCRADNNPR
jgi:hypothetical protein